VAGAHLPVRPDAPSHAPPPVFSALRQQCRYRRKVVADRARVRQHLQKPLDYEGLRRAGC